MFLFLWNHDKIFLVVISFITGIVFDRLVRLWALQFHQKRTISSEHSTREYSYGWNIVLPSLNGGCGEYNDAIQSSDDSITIIDQDREDFLSSNSSSFTTTDLQSHTRASRMKKTTNPCNLLTSPNKNEEDQMMSDEWAILQGAMKLCLQRWEQDHGETDCLIHTYTYESQQESTNNTKVVNFLTPQQVISTLFSPPSKRVVDNSSPEYVESKSLYKTLSLRRRRRRKSLSTSSSSQSLNHENEENYDIKVQSMLHLFQQIQYYSVNTSHPYFFNQMFGTLDPIALAAELIALSVHTSVYTFETAPIFTMIEREVISTLGRLIFDRKDEYLDKEALEEEDHNNDDDNNNNNNNNNNNEEQYDGLMLPGGSISNLTALHLARYASTKRLHRHHPFNVDTTFHKEILTDNRGIDTQTLQHIQEYPTNFVAFVSQEAHYSFSKAVSITGLGLSNLIIVATLSHGPMDVQALDESITRARQEGKIPFFVAVTAGSTVRGSFDDIEAILKICHKHEQSMMIHEGDRMNNTCPKIWIHVDGAWGGAAIYSKRPEIYNLMRGVDQVDSFTFNPHKMLGASQQTTAFVTRHKGIMKESNALGAKYLFDNRRVGASFDLGDNSFTCGRRSDAIKLWAMWKYYGSDGLGKMVESRVDFLSKFSVAIQEHDAFILACEPWPFNINFFYIPHRLRSLLERNGMDMKSRNPIIPNDVSIELGKVSVQLKLRLQQSGEMLIPYQPLSSQQGECFRLVIAGNKSLKDEDIIKIMNLMDKYGYDL